MVCSSGEADRSRLCGHFLRRRGERSFFVDLETVWSSVLDAAAESIEDSMLRSPFEPTATIEILC
jgi:hypothetical protein